MNPKFLPSTIEGKLGRVVEECGEFLQVIGKAGRFGLESAPPGGGPNNAALILSELADLRHAVSVVEQQITEVARIISGRGNSSLVWTSELISSADMAELLGWEGDYHALNVKYTMFNVCAGEWHREGTDWRFYKDPEFDDA